MPDFSTHIRPARVAGTFYDGNPERLKQDILERIQRASVPEVTSSILAAAVPHAGYLYSADIAAPVYAALAKADFDTVVIIGHDFGRHARGIIGITTSFTEFATPLGNVPVDTQLVQALLKEDSRIIVHDVAHRQEHTIEVQLPFLQTIARAPFQIVPMFFGEVAPVHCQRLAELLLKLKGSRRLLVLSSTDLSHYPASKVARKLDAQTVATASALDLEGLCDWQSHGEWENHPGVVTPICSAGGLGTAICWARLNGPAEARVLKQGNSGDVSGEDDRVVGYASLLFVKAGESSKNEAPSKDDFSLSASVKRQLLSLARKSIVDALENKETIPGLGDAPEHLQKAAVFVTLHKNGRLRGCIGTTAPHLPLAQAIIAYAKAAAFEDPRFTPVTAEELPLIHIEISVLSPMRKVGSAEEIVPFKHGVMVSRGYNRGLFLPQVWEQLPDKEMFLTCLCEEKAGLPANAWKDSRTNLEVFTVLAFEEDNND